MYIEKETNRNDIIRAFLKVIILNMLLVFLVLVDASVLQRQAAPEEIVCGVSVLNLRAGEFPAAAYGDAD